MKKKQLTCTWQACSIIIDSLEQALSMLNISTFLSMRSSLETRQAMQAGKFPFLIVIFYSTQFIPEATKWQHFLHTNIPALIKFNEADDTHHYSNVHACVQYRTASLSHTLEGSEWLQYFVRLLNNTTYTQTDNTSHGHENQGKS